MDVDLDEKAVDQLWSEVKGVMEVALAWMKPFLKLFGVEEGNGLSPFAVGIDSPSDLVAMIEQFFRRPKADPRGKDTVIGDVDDDEDPDAEENNADDFDEAPVVNGDEPMGVGILTTHVGEIREVESSMAEEELAVTDAETLPIEEAEMESFFDGGDSRGAFDCFKELLRCNDIGNVQSTAFDLVQLLQLGKLEKGSLSSASKYNSRNGRWFSQKASSSVSDVAASMGDEENDSGRFVVRDSLVQMKCKRGRSETIECYRVLAFFTKYYNKWFVAEQDKFPWSDDTVNTAKVRVLARLVKKTGSSYQEVGLVKDGNWAPQQVYVIESLSNVLKVEEELVEL